MGELPVNGFRCTSSLHSIFPVFLNFQTFHWPKTRTGLLWLDESKDPLFSETKQSCQFYDVQTFSLCRCGSRTEEQNGGKGNVLVKCSRSGHISQQLTSCLFSHVLRTTHRYRTSTSIRIWLPLNPLTRTFFSQNKPKKMISWDKVNCFILTLIPSRFHSLADRFITTIVSIFLCQRKLCVSQCAWSLKEEFEILGNHFFAES